MIGVFDSGMGGVYALSELRRLSPDFDIVLYKDTKNAPYGNKSESELVKLVSEDIDKLLSCGCSAVVMACCTASTVYDLLPEKYRSASIPIIDPCAKKAVEISQNKNVGVLSTEATRRSKAFQRAILKYNTAANVVSVSAPALVTMAEAGFSDENLTSTEICELEKILIPFRKSKVDTLILGCTHFAYFERTIQKILNVKTVNSAQVCAELASRNDAAGSGITVYLED